MGKEVQDPIMVWEDPETHAVLAVLMGILETSCSMYLVIQLARGYAQQPHVQRKDKLAMPVRSTSSMEPSLTMKIVQLGVPPNKMIRYKVRRPTADAVWEATLGHLIVMANQPLLDTGPECRKTQVDLEEHDHTSDLRYLFHHSGNWTSVRRQQQRQQQEPLVGPSTQPPGGCRSRSPNRMDPCWAQINAGLTCRTPIWTNNSRPALLRHEHGGAEMRASRVDQMWVQPDITTCDAEHHQPHLATDKVMLTQELEGKRKDLNGPQEPSTVSTRKASCPYHCLKTCHQSSSLSWWSSPFRTRRSRPRWLDSGSRLRCWTLSKQQEKDARLLGRTSKRWSFSTERGPTKYMRTRFSCSDKKTVRRSWQHGIVIWMRVATLKTPTRPKSDGLILSGD